MTATVRVMSPEEIATKAGGQTPWLHPPHRATLFAEREMRLRQLAPGHTMADFLLFMADVANAQQTGLAGFPAVPLPDTDALSAAARQGRPPLSAADWPRDPAWQGVLRTMAAALKARAPAGALPTLERLAQADDALLERQADALVNGLLPGTTPDDLACAPIVAAALQVYWTHMLLEVQRLQAAPGQPGHALWGRLDDPTLCPCCGSRPTASITRSAGESLGQRYLHCSLCSMQWHMVRIQCAHCQANTGLAYQALDTADDPTDGGPDGDTGDSRSSSARAAQASLQAETCDACGHYLKIMHTDRDPSVDPVADDLASLTLDLLVSDTGLRRHGINLMLLFGEPPPDDPP